MIICGDCIEVMRGMDENSVDSIVTDPPYGLGFMGKKWDVGVPAKKVFEECLRVLKPGGYLLAFGGTRTYHRLACAVEDAGFEIRDMIEWMYGSGFPKSMNVGKAVDKLQGNKREVVGEKKLWGHNAGSGAASFSKNKYEGQTGVSRTEDLTKGNSEWEGYGTALKPSHEPIVMARKPISEKTIAKNVLKWGTGGLNIDGCRIKHNEPEKLTNRTPRIDDNIFSDKSCGFKKESNHIASASQSGRWPANLIHDGSDEVLEVFPTAKSGKGNGNATVNVPHENGITPLRRGSLVSRDDSGSAARFFYCAKTSKKDRNGGCDTIPPKKIDDSRKEGNPGGDNPRNRGVNPSQNNHPTVKPTELMRYLCRLVTPPKGIVLDPFAGSGSTGKACILEGFNFILIEKEPEYCEIAKARIAAAELEVQEDNK